MRLKFLVCYATVLPWLQAEESVDFKVPAKVDDLLASYCYECHDSGTQKGKVRLDHLEELGNGKRLDLLNLALEHVFSGEMPPKKADQPSQEERDQLAEWMWGELKVFNAVKLEDKLRYYKYANYLNHDKLFSGEIAEKAFTKARRWRVNELIYHERVNEVFELKAGARQDSFFGVVKPFNLPTTPGVAYYDTEIVEGGQFLTLMANAKWIVDKQLRDALVKSGEYIFSEEYLAAKAKGGRYFNARFPDERWNPGRTAEPFERIVMTKEQPSEEMLRAAITHQFQVALQREPSDSEMAKYLGFTRKTLEVSDKTSALKKMMVSVLMEPEFLYRNEFGGGESDEHGRVMLMPREAGYAIAYALTDQVPDADLVAAAKSGKLNSREDYEREIRRLLEDNSIEKPRILRFFQDYFGYRGVYDVFKDEERFIGAYNPHRVVSTKYIYRMPGKMRKEADLFVNWVLEKDQDVLKTLLTSERFFVHHNGNNEEMKEKAAKATELAEKHRKIYKDTLNLKRDELSAYLTKINQYITKDGKVVRRFSIDQDDWKLRFGPDGTLGEGKNWTAMPPDGEAVLHSVKVWNFDYLTWSYQTEQPMKVENRTGLLTHPAWLVANSLNAATDPIHRGKWIREKLLGGFIRDVPITVDAKVPDDPHATLRERFAVSEDKACWQCHEKMNPLGYVFEQYDDFGRFRLMESLEHPDNVVEKRKVRAKGEHGVFKTYEELIYRTKPVDSTGVLEGTGDKTLDGPVKDVRDLATRLSKSDRVRQVFTRNVFRYFMGRNETFADSRTLMEADRVYLKSGGSFRELMVSLLTSDSFIYRK
ncbi:DUF1588 domain-containing protein [Akkermansiaceae bacterium]|nr:DUF1588 domain-containing protein [Akkermansiaceae bacterium]MDA7888482.1 DUF1588 domain-containing protein [Akkermansiaceae bacterium]